VCSLVMACWSWLLVRPLARLRSAPERSAPERSAATSWALERLAFQSLAPVRSAFESLASERSVFGMRDSRVALSYGPSRLAFAAHLASRSPGHKLNELINRVETNDDRVSAFHSLQ
jgi:hypothetical protein